MHGSLDDWDFHHLNGTCDVGFLARECNMELVKCNFWWREIGRKENKVFMVFNVLHFYILFSWIE